jgi:hypothetical protein
MLFDFLSTEDQDWTDFDDGTTRYGFDCEYTAA